MANASAVLPPPTHREVQPVHRCLKCGCYLRTGNISTTCDPCGTPPWEIVDANELTVRDVFAAAADAPDTNAGYQKRQIFDALLECMEEAA